MDTIKFDGNNYLIKELNSPFGNKLVSTTDLNDTIFDNLNGDYVSEEASRIDESLYYFVYSVHLNLKEEHLINLVLNQLQ